ncbi:MAG TPA: aminotransferase class III-fold pyridoxal phosphate-dependent enzyme [Polyangia bacterium]|jgi:taurine--2-oxoglutarate transaminase|nr:aminotransferase class III-fold pyridoxal phosphate-dependent enzyme [Polyangia bacterium]
MSALSDEQAARVFTTWTAQANATFLEIVGGEGARFTTADGARWWDLGSMTWNAALGHGHPRMKKALGEAAARGLLVYPTAVFPAKVRAAELLAEVTPEGLTKTFFCLSGAEANENAVKMARLVTGRKKIVARTRSYHGATLAMLSLSGDPRREPFEPGLPGVVRMGDPYCFRCPFGKEPSSCAHECAQDLETALLREGPETVAAVILEGIVGANGVFVPPAGYWKKIRAICDRYGILLIADEVLSGFGRTGRWFAVDHDGVAPDLLTMAKGLTGGYVPGGAVIVNERIARHFDDHTLVCGLTSYAHPLVCEAIVATIETLREEKLVERAAALGSFLGGRLADFARHRPVIAETRGLGLLWAFELCVPGPNGERTKTPLPPPAMEKLSASLRKHHLHMHRRDNLLYLAPPLVIEEAELDAALDALGRAFDEALEALG